MGADAFVVFFGVKFDVPDDEQALSSLEEETDERIVRSRAHRLDFRLGRLTDGAPHHFYVGHEIAELGVEGGHYAGTSERSLVSLMAVARERLTSAGFSEEPSLHCQLEAEY